MLDDRRLQRGVCVSSRDEKKPPPLPNTIDMAHTPERRRTTGWLGKQKRRVLVVVALLLVSAYAAIYTTVVGADSPTDRATTAGLVCRVIQHDEAPPERLVLVHGAPANAASWDTLLAHIERDGRAPAPRSTARAAPTHPCRRTPRSKVRRRSPGLARRGRRPSGGRGPLLRRSRRAPRRDRPRIARRARELAVSNRELLALTDENRAMRPLLGRVMCPVVVHGTWDPVCPHPSSGRQGLVEKLGHHDPCLCGSGERFRACCPRSGHLDGANRSDYGR